MNKSLKIFLFCASAFSFIGLDKLTKELAREYLKGRPAISYFNDFFRLQYAENTGAFLSLGANLPKPLSFWLLGFLPIVILLILFVYVIKKAGELSAKKMLCFSLIFAGGIGNIIDRIEYDRHVIDFMILGIGSLQTGIFNFADLYITIGALSLLLFFNRKKDRQTYQKDQPSA